MNQTLLSKLAYGIIVSPNSLHARTFTANYERNNGWFSHRTLVSSSKLLKEGLLSLKDNVTWICGNGSTIRLGNDPWVLVCPIHTPRLKPAYQLLANEKVNTLTYGHKEGWNKNKIEPLFHPEDAAAILQLSPLPRMVETTSYSGLAPPSFTSVARHIHKTQHPNL